MAKHESMPLLPHGFKLHIRCQLPDTFSDVISAFFYLVQCMDQYGLWDCGNEGTVSAENLDMENWDVENLDMEYRKCGHRKCWFRNELNEVNMN